MLRPSQHPFDFPVRRAPRHRLALGGVVLGLLAATIPLLGRFAGVAADSGLALVLLAPSAGLIAVGVAIAAILHWIERRSDAAGDA